MSEFKRESYLLEIKKNWKEILLGEQGSSTRPIDMSVALSEVNPIADGPHWIPYALIAKEN